MHEQEEWRPVVGIPGYSVSSLGRVVSHRRVQPRIMRPAIHDTGYPRLHFYVGGQRHTRYVHRLVAEAFHGPCPEGQEVRHLNGDKLDARASNIQWGTRSENVLDRVTHGTHNTANRTHCPSDHPYDEANTRWYQGRRYCKACQRARSSAYYERQMLRAASVPTERAA